MDLTGRFWPATYNKRSRIEAFITPGPIIERRRKDGSAAYLAKISITRDKRIVHRENKTFDRRQAAAAWIARRAEELSRPGTPLGSSRSRDTLDKAIETTISETKREIGQTKAQVLVAIRTYPIASRRCDQITSADIVAFATKLASGGRQSSTVGNYLAHLSAVFSVAPAAWSFPLDTTAMQDATTVANRLGITGKSRQHDRRPNAQ